MTPTPLFPPRAFTRLLLLVIAPLWLLAGCAETELAVHTAKQFGRGDGGAGGGRYKVGRPYKINNVWYFPKVDYAYREQGVASWYGPGFHGRRTANGERFDQNAMTAAHPTLPMPSMVRVTNLENGRSVRVRVNDRGPFARGRIIDLSRAAAESLGFRRKGVAQVLVEIVPDESRLLAGETLIAKAPTTTPATTPATTPIWASIDAPDAVPVAAVAAQPLPPEGAAIARPIPVAARIEGQGGVPGAGTSLLRSRIVALPSRGSSRALTAAAPPPRTVQPVAARPEPLSGLFVQAGAFTEASRARELQAALDGMGDVSIAAVVLDGQPFYRVRIGPMPSAAAADRVLADLQNTGIGNARLIWQ